MRHAAAAAAAVALLAASCGGQQPDTQDAQLEPERTVVARAVEPPPLEDDSSSLPESDTSLPEDDQSEQAQTTPITRPARKRHRTSSNAILSAADKTSFNRLISRLGGKAGLAVSGVGRGRKVERVGSLNRVVAWSTSKVPIAMAVVDAGGQSAQAKNLTAAITASDNAAAAALWSSLGSPDQAAAAANAELRQAGDSHTSMETRVLRAGLSSFGQTVWTLADQARFTAGMPCSASGQVVLGLMGQVIPAQRWGLGSAGAHFKGGWGPGSSPGQAGGYLDRQMGIVTISGKPLAVSIASLPANGAHDSGTRVLTEITRWLVAHANVDAQPAQATC